jgi:hypothetical protein
MWLHPGIRAWPARGESSVGTSAQCSARIVPPTQLPSQSPYAREEVIDAKAFKNVGNTRRIQVTAGTANFADIVIRYKSSSQVKRKVAKLAFEEVFAGRNQGIYKLKRKTKWLIVQTTMWYQQSLRFSMWPKIRITIFRWDSTQPSTWESGQLSHT